MLSLIDSHVGQVISLVVVAKSAVGLWFSAEPQTWVVRSADSGHAVLRVSSYCGKTSENCLEFDYLT